MLRPGRGGSEIPFPMGKGSLSGPGFPLKLFVAEPECRRLSIDSSQAESYVAKGIAKSAAAGRRKRNDSVLEFLRPLSDTALQLYPGQAASVRLDFKL